jgi:hypothetical protein
VPKVIVDGVFVSKFVSKFVLMWIFEGDREVYIFPLCLQVELRREVNNSRVIGFDFENVCSDEKSGNCRFVTPSSGPWIGPMSRIDRRG